jgi:predicted AlkP superfamily pyrophosphatase or phosphodiesterase
VANLHTVLVATSQKWTTSEREGIVRRLERSCLGLALLWLFAPYSFSAQETRLVVLISLDGFPAQALGDPRLPMPTLRKLMAEGTTAESMRPVNPTVTWPNHTAMVTGVSAASHQVLFNGTLVRRPDGSAAIEPWLAKDQMVNSPTVYDLAYEAGLTTAQVDWVAIYKAKTIHWQFPENPDARGAIEGELVARRLVTEEQLEDFDHGASSAWQDEIWTDAAVDILKEHRPNLLLVHLLTLDNTNHEYRPGSNASFTAMALLDRHLEQILDAIKESGRLHQATVLIVSDHGFETVHNVIHPDAFLQKQGFARNNGGDAHISVSVLCEGGVALVYINDRARKNEWLPQLRDLFGKLEGVDRVIGESEFTSLGLPRPAQSNQGPDLVLTAKQDYQFENGTTGEVITRVPAGRGTHGFLNSDPAMQAVFLAWGAGIRKGSRIGPIDNIDVAPTIAKLLGLQMKTAQGRVLQEILETKQ